MEDYGETDDFEGDFGGEALWATYAGMVALLLQAKQWAQLWGSFSMSRLWDHRVLARVSANSRHLERGGCRRGA